MSSFTITWIVCQQAELSHICKDFFCRNPIGSGLRCISNLNRDTVIFQVIQISLFVRNTDIQCVTSTFTTPYRTRLRFKTTNITTIPNSVCIFCWEIEVLILFYFRFTNSHSLFVQTDSRIVSVVSIRFQTCCVNMNNMVTRRATDTPYIRILISKVRSCKYFSTTLYSFTYRTFAILSSRDQTSRNIHNVCQCSGYRTNNTLICFNTSPVSPYVLSTSRCSQNTRIISFTQIDQILSWITFAIILSIQCCWQAPFFFNIISSILIDVHVTWCKVESSFHCPTFIQIT